MRASFLQFIVTILLSTSLISCMVGPDFHKPCPPTTQTYTKAPLPSKTVSIPKAGNAGQAQYFNSCADLPAAWWTLYHSPEINDLICTGLANSPTLAAAQAALRQAQENWYAQVGASLFPSVNASMLAERQRFSFQTLGLPGTNVDDIFNLYNPAINVSYTLDIFGGARRQIEALCAQVDFQRFQMEAAYLTLTSNIVTLAITGASLRAQIQATQGLIQSQEEQLAIVRKQLELGGASGADVLSQEAQVAQTRATLPPLAQKLVQNNHALSILLGEFPSESCLHAFDLDKLNLPTELPVSLPSCLVRQRPDIRASEALLHAASAQIGVATANMLPQITLNASYGWTNNIPADLFSINNTVWSYSATALQPLFNAGSLRAKRRSAIAGYEQAAAQYRQTVLQAFQNVADSLRALENDARGLQALKQAEIAARGSLILTQKQYRLGGVSYLSLLNAQKQYQQALINRIQAQAARYNDTAALFLALGGGWWNRPCDVETIMIKV